LERRDFPPGVHTWRRGKVSEYGKRFREKQKVKRFYGIFERQFKKYFESAENIKGSTGENVLIMLERRLDNAVLRGGFALSRPQARQLIRHCHIFVNGKLIDIPSYQIKEGDVIQPANHDSAKKLVDNAVQAYKPDLPSWLERSADGLELKVVHLPVRNEVPLDVHEALIVEFFSR
jgi:small subunit ribosomal protein S4